MGVTELPSLVFALFYDDVRYEIGNKLSFIGQYLGEIRVGNSVWPPDRLVVAVNFKFPLEANPESLTIHIDLPKGEPTRISYPLNLLGVHPDPSSPFAGRFVQVAIPLRFPPLEGGEIIDVWAEVADQRFPAGRLHVVEMDSSPDTIPESVTPKKSSKRRLVKRTS